MPIVALLVAATIFVTGLKSIGLYERVESRFCPPADSGFATAAKNLEESCRREGYALIITNTDDRYQNGRELLRMFVAWAFAVMLSALQKEDSVSAEEILMPKLIMKASVRNIEAEQL